MDLYEFNQLPIKHKANFTWNNCSFLTSRSDDYGRKINLYHSGKFFVEVYYNPKENAIVKFRAFKSTRCLEPYLDLIEI